MIYIFRCWMVGHIEVTKNEPYIGTGDRPLCDMCYDIAEEGMYFVGIDNLGAGIAGGEGLGNSVSSDFDPKIPKLILSKYTALSFGPVS